MSKMFFEGKDFNYYCMEQVDECLQLDFDISREAVLDDTKVQTFYNQLFDRVQKTKTYGYYFDRKTALQVASYIYHTKITEFPDFRFIKYFEQYTYCFTDKDFLLFKSDVAARVLEHLSFVDMLRSIYNTLLSK